VVPRTSGDLSEPALLGGVSDHRLRQEFNTPTPGQSGIVEGSFRSAKQECVWRHSFESFTETRGARAHCAFVSPRHIPHLRLHAPVVAAGDTAGYQRGRGFETASLGSQSSDEDVGGANQRKGPTTEAGRDTK